MYLASQAPSDVAARLGEIKVPALVITGDDDRIVPPALAVRLSKELPDAKLVILSKCGHMPQEECPQAFLDAVGQFVERLLEARETDVDEWR